MNLKDIDIEIIVCAVLLLLLIVFALFFTYFEAKTYNKITGADVTMWDALWVQLKICGEK